MPLHNTRTVWGWPAKALHWIVAALIVGLLLVGTWMSNFLNDMVLQYELTQWHKSFGVVVFALACVRLVWRWVSPVTPALPQGQPAHERLLVHLTHYGMYLLMFLMPISGWLMASASPLNDEGAYPVQIRNMVFGLFELPDPVAPGDKELEALLHAIHMYSSWALAGLLVLHLVGVFVHHVQRRDNTLLRMLPFAPLREEQRET